MTRFLLGAVVLCLALLAIARWTASPADQQPTPAPARAAAEAVPPPVVQAAAVPAVVTPAADTVAPDAPAPTRTPHIDRMARLEARRRLDWSAQSTYLDSLFLTPDSTVRRWTGQRTVRVAILVPAPLDARVRAALEEWNTLRLGVPSTLVPDSIGAEIVFLAIDRFPLDADPGASPDEGRTGLTELRSDGGGEIRSARITLAREDATGRPLTPAQFQAIALHELGHAFGLPHSGRREDIMFPTVSVTALSERDRATARLLYALPPGSLRDPSP